MVLVDDLSDQLLLARVPLQKGRVVLPRRRLATGLPGPRGGRSVAGWSGQPRRLGIERLSVAVSKCLDNGTCPASKKGAASGASPSPHPFDCASTNTGAPLLPSSWRPIRSSRRKLLWGSSPRGWNHRDARDVGRVLSRDVVGARHLHREAHQRSIAMNSLRGAAESQRAAVGGVLQKRWMTAGETRRQHQ